jgi:hypothetical protein
MYKMAKRKSNSRSTSDFILLEKNRFFEKKQKKIMGPQLYWINGNIENRNFSILKSDFHSSTTTSYCAAESAANSNSNCEN